MEERKQRSSDLHDFDAVRRQFIAEGISINGWAKLRGYKPRTVYAVLQGKLECRHGVSHQIAVELGLKAVPEQKRLVGGNR